MVLCSFCHKNILPGTGKIFAYKDGKTLHFCGSKCEKNMIKLGRNPVNVKWTQEVEE